MNSHHPPRLGSLVAALCIAFAASSCSGVSTPSGAGTGPASASPAATAPAASPSSGAISQEPSPSLEGEGSVDTFSTYSGTWDDVQYAFDYPSDWTVEDTTQASPKGSEVRVTSPDGNSRAVLTILIAWGAECPCVEHPAVHLGDVPGQAPLSKSGPFLVRSMALDLTGSPQERATHRWPDNVKLITSLTRDTGPAPAVLVPQLMYGLGLVETGVVAANGETQRTIIFSSSGDFGTLEQAQAYAGSDEHRQSQQIIASFREGTS